MGATGSPYQAIEPEGKVTLEKILEAPKDVAELKKLIVCRSREFPESLKRVLELSFTRPDAIAFSNVASLAASCQIAPTSVSRTVKALGYKSFRDFRQIYRDHILTLSRRSCSDPPGCGERSPYIFRPDALG